MQSKTTRAFRTISEAGEELGLQPHVLRFWESKFPQIKPMKRGGGRRFYRPEDIEFLRGIKILLHDEKHPIKDVQKLIRVKGPSRVLELGRSVERAAKPKPIEDTVLIPQRIIDAESAGTAPVAASVPQAAAPPPAPIEATPAPAPVTTEATPIPAPISRQDGPASKSAARSFFRPVAVEPEAPKDVQPEDVLDLTQDIVEENGNASEATAQPAISAEDRESLETALERLQALRSRWTEFQKD